jgi:hypothetical protein
VTAEWPWYARFRPIQQWPGETTRSRRQAQFSAKWASTLTLLGRELEHLGRKNVVVQVALTERDIRNDGFPRANARPDHPGVIVSLDSKYGPLSYPCDTFTTWQDNLRGIALALESLVLHPDTGGSPEEFQRLQEAKRVLDGAR